MFFDEDLLVKSGLAVPWQMGTNQKPLKEARLLTVCSTLKKHIDVSKEIKKKQKKSKKIKPLSLRTSSILINGTAKLYRDEADKLWNDCVDLYHKMLPKCSSDEDESTASEMEESNSDDDRRRKLKRRRETVPEEVQESSVGTRDNQHSESFPGAKRRSLRSRQKRLE